MPRAVPREAAAPLPQVTDAIIEELVKITMKPIIEERDELIKRLKDHLRSTLEESSSPNT